MNKQQSAQRKFKHILLGLLLTSLTFPAFVNAQSNDAHHKDYLAALELVAQSEARIAEAMRKVQSGQVAHYDYLQNEHIELIRHARALAWPPGSISQVDKNLLREDAVALLNSAESLEWVISDYLRAIAQVRIATSNTLDIAEQAQQHSSDTLNAALETLKQATLMFMASAYDEGWSTLTQAYDTVLAADIAEQTHKELQAQKERLALFIPQLQLQMASLLASDVDVRAAHLQALYAAAL